MSKQFWAVIAAIVIIFLGIFALGGGGSKKTNSTKDSAALSQHFEGSKSSGVTLTEYGDYQCPYCEAYYPTVSQVVDEYKGQIQFQFRNYPLVNAHPNAFAAARAAEAASLQGKFWEMHNALYNSNNYQVWTNTQSPLEDFVGYAKGIGLDTAKFRTDFASEKVNDTINADKNEGDRLGLQGTPSFYINGKSVSISNNAADFQKAIKDAIAKQGKTTTTTSTAPVSTDTTAPAPEQTPVQ